MSRSTRNSCLSIAAAVFAALLPPSVTCHGQETAAPSVSVPVQQQEASSSDEQQQRFDAFTELMTGAKFKGSFTVTGRESGELTSEEYHIKSVQKSDVGDYWVFTARIKYSGKDYSVPMPLEVKWAGDTPVITVSDVRFLGQGPFNARVVIHEHKYAGTWSHGDHGGHLFGTIEPGAAEGVEVDGDAADKDDGKDDDKN